MKFDTMVKLDEIDVVGYAVVAGSTIINIPVAGFMQSFGVFVQRFDALFCKPNDCLLLLGKTGRAGAHTFFL